MVSIMLGIKVLLLVEDLLIDSTSVIVCSLYVLPISVIVLEQ